MDVDPVTDSDEVAFFGYEAMIGSEFKKRTQLACELDASPSFPDLLHPKLKRGEPRDKLHAEWANQLP